eukprot:617234-Alexandrium_andersonii.AAC.1
MHSLRGTSISATRRTAARSTHGGQPRRTTPRIHSTAGCSELGEQGPDVKAIGSVGDRERGGGA